MNNDKVSCGNNHCPLRFDCARFVNPGDEFKFVKFFAPRRYPDNSVRCGMLVRRDA